MREITRILTMLEQRVDAPAVLATLVQVEGSSYRVPGARLLWFPDGARSGSISGGCLEGDVIEQAKVVLATGRARRVAYDMAAENDLVWGTGSGCAGRVLVLLEPVAAIRPAWIAAVRRNLTARVATRLVITHDGAGELGTQLAGGAMAGAAAGQFLDVVQPPPQVLVFGAGDDAQPLACLAQELGWQVTVVDSRAATATAARFPGATVLVAPPESAVTAAAIDARTLAVVMTHRFREDAVLLRALLAAPVAYLGVLGPRRRTERLLVEIGVAVAPAKLHAPVGLDLGGDTPEAVALAVLAEMQCRMTGRAPIHLRDRAAPIHG